MPVALPPQVVTLSTPEAYASHASPLRAEVSSGLQREYDLAMRAWGGEWVGAQVQVTGRSLSKGLAMLLSRQNPDLDQALIHTSGSHFVFNPTLSEAAQSALLQKADARLLTTWTTEGWLTELPGNEVEGVAKSESSGFYSTRFVVHVMGTPEMDLQGQALSRGMDPVALRWFVLAHEAAHGEVMKAAQPFQEVNWTPEENAAANSLWFSKTDQGNIVALVYAESFSDAYGAMMTLAMTKNAPTMRDTLAKFQQFRHDVQTKDDEAYAKLRSQNGSAYEAGQLMAGFGLLNAHRTNPALDQVLADVQSGKLDLNRLTPDEAKARVRQYASDSVVAFLVSPLGRAVANLDWAHDRYSPGEPAMPDSTPLEAHELLRAMAYVMHRYEDFALAPPGVYPAATDPGGDPIFQALAKDDLKVWNEFHHLSASDQATWRAQFLSSGKELIASDQVNALSVTMTHWMQGYMARHGSEVRKELSATADVVEQAEQQVNQVAPGTLGARLRSLGYGIAPSVETPASPRLTGLPLR